MKRFAALLLISCATGLAAQKRPFTIEDVYRAKSITEMALSHDGHLVAYTVATTDLPRGKRTTHIWVMNSDGTNNRQLTSGDNDSDPAWSPDGQTLAFSRQTDSTTNIWLLPLGGGEARQLTKISSGVSGLLWSPDGKWIAFATDVYPKCADDDACNKKISDTWTNGKLKAHVVSNGLLYRHWKSWKDGTQTHTWVANSESGVARDVTPGPYDFPPFSLGGPLPYDFSPDSQELVVESIHASFPEISTNSDLWAVSLTGAHDPANLTTTNTAWDGSPRYSPDGRYIAYRMQKQPGYESDRFRLALFDRKSNESKVISESFDNWVDDFRWSADSKSIYFTGPVEGHNPIFRLDLAGGAITKIFDDRTIDAFELGTDNRLYYIQRSVSEPWELYRVDLKAANAPRQKLSYLNDALVAAVDVRPAEMMWVTGAEGAKIQVFVVKPHDFDPNKKYPLIVNVHGGPQSQWADSFRGDWQVYPGAGYVVAFPNPHGSTGFGQAFTSSISGDWGGKPFEDVMKVTDALEKLPYVDPTRMAAMGWSYGGYFIDWTEGHTRRFRVLASMMGIFDLRSFYGATEELWFPEWDLKGLPWTSDQYEKWSPSNFVKEFKTPCLVITGERDYRVPYTQSLEMYTALQKMGVPAELIVYSDAGHWPSWYEMALYYTAHLEWFRSYLGGDAPPWTVQNFLKNAVFDSATGERVDLPKPAKQEPAKGPENMQGKPDTKPQS